MEQIEEKEEKQVIKATSIRFSEMSAEEKEDLEEKYKNVKKRIFNIMQYCKHPVTEEVLLTEDKIIEALSKFKSCNYAYILHDKDLKEDRETPKPPHFHIVIQTDNPVKILTVAKRFDLMPNFIECPRGRNSFADCCEYLTHEHPTQQKKGKHLYADEEVKSNFEFREFLEEIQEKRLKKEFRENMSRKTYYLSQIHDGSMTLNDVLEEDIEFYYDNERDLKHFRYAYLQENAEMPRVRQNFYIYGEGGTGKDVMSRALARSLFPELTNDNEIFFEVGGNGVLFDGYDGQPVLIWSDYRAIELLRAFNYNRGMLFKIFDTHPTKINLNIKYGKVNLINEYNIVNSVEPYNEFLDGLAGEYTSTDGIEHSAEDKKQSYRRFPVIIPVRTQDFSVLINHGFLGTGSYFEYKKIEHIIANFKKIVSIEDEEKRREIERRTLRTVCEESNKIKEMKAEEFDEEEFSDYGKTINEVLKEEEEKYPW